MTAESIVQPPPSGWTVRDLDRLPDDGQRYELIDGVVSVAAAPSALHQYVAARLAWLLGAAAPSDRVVLPAVGVVLAADQCPIPDVVVLRNPVDYRLNRFPAAETLLAVEVVSPSTRSADRLRKPGQYAEAGIPYYWRVELDPLQVFAGRLADDGRYVEYCRGQQGERFATTEPFEIAFDPAVLLP